LANRSDPEDELQTNHASDSDNDGRGLVRQQRYQTRRHKPGDGGANQNLFSVRWQRHGEIRGANLPWQAQGLPRPLLQIDERP